MNNFKKIGMSALAASLVSTSAFAGEFTASGSASVTMEGWSGSLVNTSRGLSMADSVYLTGSTELDNGLTVSMAFELDAGADMQLDSFDDHSSSQFLLMHLEQLSSQEMVDLQLQQQLMLQLQAICGITLMEQHTLVLQV